MSWRAPSLPLAFTRINQQPRPQTRTWALLPDYFIPPSFPPFHLLPYTHSFIHSTLFMDRRVDTLPGVHIKDRAGSHQTLVLWGRQPSRKEEHETMMG